MKTLHQFDEVFDTQAVFRKVLEAMSNPMRGGGRPARQA